MNYRLLVLSALLSITTFNVTAASNGVPALSVIAPNGQESILIGSLHAGIDGLRQPDKSVFNNAKRFVIEHGSKQTSGGENGANNPKRNSLPSLPVWAQSLTDKEITTYYIRANCYGLSKELTLGSLFLPTTQFPTLVAYTICENSGIKSRDTWMDSIKPRKLQTDDLEDADWVESQRLLVDADNDNTGLKWILARDPKTVLNSVRDALNNGDYGFILDYSTAPFVDPKVIEKYKSIMVTGRNLAWMPRLKQYLDDGHAVILVGAGHLPGENGLISLLQSNGYTVKAITLPESQ